MLLELRALYEKLLEKYGYQNWWPVDLEYHKAFNQDPKDEIIIGAILTQNTSWKNVEKALNNLKKEKALSLEVIKHINEAKLKELIRPAGFFERKSKVLKDVSFKLDKKPSRELLLSIRGIGKETADSIMLYAFDELYFVVDLYTKRFFSRVFNKDFLKLSYDEVQSFIQRNIDEDITLYKEFHALIVRHSKDLCKKSPSCYLCFLRNCYYAKL